ADVCGLYGTRSLRLLEAAHRRTIYDDPTVDDHPIRPDICRKFTVLRLVYRNDVSTGHTHTGQDPCCRLRDCIIWRSPVVVHVLEAKGDWILSGGDFTSRCVPAGEETSNPAHRLTSAHQPSCSKTWSRHTSSRLRCPLRHDHPRSIRLALRLYNSPISIVDTACRMGCTIGKSVRIARRKCSQRHSVCACRACASSSGGHDARDSCCKGEVFA